jgi:hypothetical protein
MTPENRLSAVNTLITAAQALLEQGHTMPARSLIQSARIVAAATNAFLDLNKVTIEADLMQAESIIKRAAKT